jgi:hypothetical protein
VAHSAACAFALVVDAAHLDFAVASAPKSRQIVVARFSLIKMNGSLAFL